MLLELTHKQLHHMQVRTYDVVPVSSSLGLVEFVPDTQPLKHAIMAFMDPEVHPAFPPGLPELPGHDTVQMCQSMIALSMQAIFQF